MVTELDIYRSANVLIRQHGEKAMLEAVMLCDACRQKGDAMGAAVWRCVIRAIDELEREGPREGEWVS